MLSWLASKIYSTFEYSTTDQRARCVKVCFRTFHFVVVDVLPAEQFPVQIREIAIKIDVVGVGAAFDPSSAFAGGIGDRPSVGVHRRQDPNSCPEDEVDHVLVACFVHGAEIVDEFEKHFAPDHFVAVHVADVSGGR